MKVGDIVEITITEECAEDFEPGVVEFITNVCGGTLDMVYSENLDCDCYSGKFRAKILGISKIGHKIYVIPTECADGEFCWYAYNTQCSPVSTWTVRKK